VEQAADAHEHRKIRLAVQALARRRAVGLEREFALPVAKDMGVHADKSRDLSNTKVQLVRYLRRG
jgi:hypothetical protein